MRNFSFWNVHTLSRIDYRVIPIITILMCISLLVISANSLEGSLDTSEEIFFTPAVLHQVKAFALGIVVYLFFAGFDYNKLREWTWLLYILMLFSLIGLFFTDPIQRVHRWYRIPFINFGFQPSEYAKLIVVIALSWFMEHHKTKSSQPSTALVAGLIVFIPFILILKQPDLGTALVLYPITLVMFYFGNINSTIIRIMTWLGAIALIIVALIFLEVLSYKDLRPYATQIIKEYQYDRLDPHNHHQKASSIAIAVGGLFGTGWKKSEFTGGGWLPMPYTDSVFPAFGEEFGFFGLIILIALFYALIYFSFQVTAVAQDHFGRLLSAGITTYVAIHIIVNIGMMCGLLPITGVPLLLVTYGGSSVISTMAALGILQSIYSRRFMF